MPHWINQPWQRNLRKTASGKPGAVQTTNFQRSNGYYNLRRKHSALGSKSPLAFERQEA